LYRFAIEWPNLVQFHDFAILPSTKVQFPMILSFFCVFSGWCFSEFDMVLLWQKIMWNLSIERKILSSRFMPKFNRLVADRDRAATLQRLDLRSWITSMAASAIITDFWDLGADFRNSIPFCFDEKMCKFANIERRKCRFWTKFWPLSGLSA